MSALIQEGDFVIVASASTRSWNLAPVVEKVDSRRYPVDSAIGYPG